MSFEQVVDNIFELLGLEGPFSSAKSKSKNRKKASARGKDPRSTSKRKTSAAPSGTKAKSSTSQTRPLPQAPGRPDRSKSAGGQSGAASRKPPARKRGSGFVHASTQQVADLLAYKGKVLSAKDGIFEVSEKGQSICAALEDGTILLVEGNALSPVFSNLRKKLANKDHIVTRQLYVDEETLHKIYLNYERSLIAAKEFGKSDTAKMRKDFFDLVQRASDEKASDIHILNQRYEAIVRIRADGVMQDFSEYSSQYATEFMSAVFYMSDVSDSSYRPLEYQGARISSESTLPEGIQSIRLQFNPLPNGGRQMVARLLYAQTAGGDEGEDIDALGYSAIHVKDMKIMRKKPFGIVIISGPTGSGKSTTLQKALTALMKEKRYQINVLTIEDPPEYIIEGAAQIPVTNADSEEERSKKFTAAISAALRSDPDVIMIGEIRDKASSGLAFAASMTGHQVWASLHANDAVSILDRFKDQQVEEYKLCDPTLVTGLVGQRLMRKLCNTCKVPLKDAMAYEDDRVLDPLMMESLEEKFGPELYDRFFLASEGGCDACRNGYTGRTVVAETIVPDRQFMQKIAQQDKVGAIEYWKKNLNGMSILEHAVLKMLKGEVDPREVEDKVEPLNMFEEDRLNFCLKHADAEIASEKAKAESKKKEQEE